MTAVFHPEFPHDIRKFEAEYARISVGLGNRFRSEVDDAIENIKQVPERAGHFLSQTSLGAAVSRRRNLRSFPFFILYSLVGDRILFGAVIPSRSDPLTWLRRFAE